MNPTLEEIRRLRKRNNDFWMELLDIALETAPEQTKTLLQNIASYDTQITRLLKELADE